MRWIVLAGPLVAAFLLRSAEAQTSMIMGVGGLSCGTWTEAKREGEAFEYRAWMLGFLSGIGIASITWQPHGQSVDPLTGTDKDGVLGWVDNYCQAHPLDLIAAAGWAFVRAHPR
jgi:hypothetical protein